MTRYQTEAEAEAAEAGGTAEQRPAAENDPEGFVASGQPPTESPLKRRALPEVLAELDDVRGRR